VGKIYNFLPFVLMVHTIATGV